MLSKIKKYIRIIQKLDRGIYQTGADFAEVYARNAALEEEIAFKTKELAQTNQTILTLNSVWEMMNSPQPLSSMLDKISDILSRDMGYLGVMILQLVTDEKGKKIFCIKSFSGSNDISEIEKVLTAPLINVELSYDETNYIAKAIEENIIKSSSKPEDTIRRLYKNIPPEQVEQLCSMIKAQCEIVLPLTKNKKQFGCVLIYSPRTEISDIEMNFLTLFVNQIELGITVAELFEEVKQQAITDPLTQIYNRRYFEGCLIKEAERSIRQKQPFSIISLDLDHLKVINDTYGHQYGDIAIKTIADVMKRESRSVDIYARIGGEEFNILLPGVDSAGAGIAAERIRKAIADKQIEKIGHVTASIGVATFLEHSDRIDELVEMADQAMYKAKTSGRNRVKIAEKTPETPWQETAIKTFMQIVEEKRINIDSTLSEEILSQLKSVGQKNKSSQEILCSIADLIAQCYNKMYKKGTTKSKILLATMLARRLNLSKSDTDNLKIAMLVYDIGNIMIPTELLNKKTELSEEERNTIKMHPVIAAKGILNSIERIEHVLPIIENHHEHWNGGGYPNNIAENNIPLTSQIILLVDAFYAMTQDRPYRKAYTIDETLEIIREESDKQWNKDLVKEFFNVIKNEELI